MKLPHGPSVLLVMVSGFIVWTISFAALYAGLSLACSHRAVLPLVHSPMRISLLLGTLWAIHLAVLALMVYLSWRRDPVSDTSSGAGQFAVRTMRYLNVAAAFATLWVGFPLLFLPPCL